MDSLAPLNDKPRSHKEALLLESDINRQVLALELDQFRLRGEQIRESWQFSGFKWVAPVVGLLAAWKFKKVSSFFFKSGFGLILVRKLWDRFERRHH